MASVTLYSRVTGGFRGFGVVGLEVIERVQKIFWRGCDCRFFGGVDWGLVAGGTRDNAVRLMVGVSALPTPRLGEFDMTKLGRLSDSADDQSGLIGGRKGVCGE